MNIVGKNLRSNFKNAGITVEDRTQNRFTAYISRAVWGSKNKYLKQKIRYENTVSPYFDFIDIQKEPLVDSESLTCILLSLNEREQAIFHNHVMLKLTHSEIAAKLSMTLPAVQKSYQRLIKKLRQEAEV